MRDFKSMKRQRGRNRKPGGGSGGGQGHGNNPNRAFDSNGPEGLKVRGNAQHVYERYQQLARDAAAAGDRVLAENFLQHAEHYFRLIRAMQPQRPVSDIAARDAFASGFDIDFEDESGIPQVAEGFENETQPQSGEGGEQRNEGGQNREGQHRDGEYRRDNNGARDFNRGDRDNYRDRDGNRDRDNNRSRDDRPRDDRPRDDRSRDDRPRNDRNRDDRPREDRSRDDRPRDDRPRDDRPREDRPRDDRPAAEGEGRRETRRERFERQRGDRAPRYGDEDRSGEASADPLAVVQPQATPLVERPAKASPRLRAEDGGESHMPAFLGRAATPVAADAPEAVEKPKRAPRKKKAAEEPAGEDA